MSEELRKCSVCHENIEIENPNADYILDGKKYVHCGCFIKYKTSLKKSAWTFDKCKEYLIEKQITTKVQIQNKLARKRITDWIIKKYEIAYLPTYLFLKLDEIYKGTFKGLSKPVLPEDLLYMWQSKESYLEKVSLNNKKNGKEIVGIGRVNYDLAILLSKYGSFLEWKEKQKMNTAQIINSQEEITHKIMYNEVSKRTKTADNININDILDEI